MNHRPRQPAYDEVHPGEEADCDVCSPRPLTDEELHAFTRHTLATDLLKAYRGLMNAREHVLFAERECRMNGVSEDQMEYFRVLAEQAGSDVQS